MKIYQSGKMKKVECKCTFDIRNIILTKIKQWKQYLHFKCNQNYIINVLEGSPAIKIMTTERLNDSL